MLRNRWTTLERNHWPTFSGICTAHESDTNALIPAIEDTKKRNLAPTKLLADTLYGSDKNIENAKKMGVEVVAPAMGGKEQAITLADFQFSETDEIIACPVGQQPKKIKIGKNGGLTVHFEKTLCDNCPQQSNCPLKRSKKRCTINYDSKS